MDPPPQQYDVYGARIRASDGALLDAGGVLIAASSYGCSDLAIAQAPNGSSGYLVVWVDGSLRGWPVSAALTALGSDAGAATVIGGSSPSGVVAPAVVRDGDHYLATWRSPNPYPDATIALVAARVASDGTPLDTTPFVIQDSLRAAQGAALASAGAGHSVVAYARFVDDTGYGAAHARARFICDGGPFNVGGGGKAGGEAGGGTDGSSAQAANGKPTSNTGGCASTSTSSGDAGPWAAAWLVALAAIAARVRRRRG